MKNLYYYLLILATIILTNELKSQNFQFQGLITSDTIWQADTLEMAG